MSNYKPRFGNFAGIVGVMVGRVADCSNNDIRLKFPCGTLKWYQFNDVVKVDNNTTNLTVTGFQNSLNIYTNLFLDFS
jgi:hypothetical protein